MNTLPTTSAYPPGYGTGPGTVNGNLDPAAQGVYDKPADRRLAPWIVLGSVILGLFAALLIIFTFVKQGNVHSLWGLLVAGIVLAPAALVGLFAGLTRRSQLAGLFFWLFVAGFVAAAVVLIINAARLDVNMDHRCNAYGGRATTGCDSLRQYHIITYTAFGAFFVTWVPTFLIVSAYFWRITRLYRKEPYEGARHDLYGNRYPVGQPVH